MTTSSLLESEELAAQVELPEPMETDEALYELVNGKRVEMPPMSIRSVMVASRLGSKLNAFVQEGNVGEVFPEMLFRIPLSQDATRERRPDIAVVSYQNWPVESPQDPDANAWEVIPDLAVEVISPSDRAEDQREKVLEYFRVGVRCVWVVYPKLRLIDVYESPTRVQILTETDTLRGDPVLPGFELTLASLFDTARQRKN
jgi:Uma2 family endonuclease